ncbi:MAG: hypothetical protein IJN88_04910 [Clostridia bacterium]|nr:hypothetical protein [Clostridia bacterium]
MKRIISVVLVIVMLFTFAAPAGAAGGSDYRHWGNQIPVVVFHGDGEPIYNTEGEKVFHFSEMLNMLGGSAEGALAESVVNVLMPFLMEGIVNDNWDPYYDALEKEIGELFTEARYDENGENWNGTDVSKAVRQQMVDNLKRDTKKIYSHKSYGAYDYQFWYDWRQDPLKTADELHEYIQGVKKITGSEKVSLMGRCLGSTIIMAYVAKYGTDDIHGVAFNGSVAAGGEIISETISGKFEIDLAAINRMLTDFNVKDNMGLDPFITKSLDLAAKVAMVAGIEFEETKIYGKLVQGVTSALALSTFFTWPGYWALVTEGDYDEALRYVFGKEGSAKREKYAKLIEKTDAYHELVASNIDGILQTIKDNEVKTVNIAKYGYQIAPVIESRNQIGDQFVTLKLASFGATTSTVFETLPEEYIQSRIDEGKGKYISPDKQIDASTCFFPDSTWFTKGISHSDWTDFETGLLYQVVTADRQLTVDDFDCTQFVCYDNETQTAYPMTEENCHIENWKVSSLNNPKTEKEALVSVIKSLIDWAIELIKIIVGVIEKNQAAAPIA